MIKKIRKGAPIIWNFEILIKISTQSENALVGVFPMFFIAPSK